MKHRLPLQWTCGVLACPKRIRSAIRVVGLLAALVAATLCRAAHGQDGRPADFPDSTPTEHDQALPAPSVTGTRDFLHLMGISESELSFVEDQNRLIGQADETLYSLLKIVPRLPKSKLPQWTLPDWTWSDLVNQPEQFRGECITIAGRVKSIRRHAVPDSIVKRMGFSHFFVVTMDRLESPEQHVTIVTRSVPAVFADATDDIPMEQPLRLDERSRTTGIVFKTIVDEASAERPPGLVIVSENLEWFPDDPASPFVSKPEFITLANLGVDIGTFDAITDRRGLAAEESDCFYQLLAAVSRPSLERMQQWAQTEGAVELLQNPGRHRAKFFTYRGTARRAIKIIVDDPVVRDALGISHYYELEVFDSQATVSIRRGKSHDPPVVFNSYPVVFCTRELPDGMTTGDFIHENVEITGAYFKLWAYRTQFMDSKNASQDDGDRLPLQISPLLIGKKPIRIVSTASKPQSGFLVGIGFVGVLVALWLIVWWVKRGDRRFRETTLSRLTDLPDDK